MLHQARLTLLTLTFTLALPALAAEPAPSPPAKATVKATVALAPVSDKDYAQKVVGARKGKAVLVTFWASYCLPCLGEIPALLELQKSMAKKGGDIVFVNVDPPGDPAQIEKVATAKKLPPFESLQVTNDDPQPFIDAVDKKWMGEVPYAVLYARDGTLKRAFSGEQKVSDLEKALAEAL